MKTGVKTSTKRFHQKSTIKYGDVPDIIYTNLCYKIISRKALIQIGSKPSLLQRNHNFQGKHAGICGK